MRMIDSAGTSKSQIFENEKSKEKLEKDDSLFFGGI